MFNRIPILKINDKDYIWQSNSIIRYIAKISNTLPNDDFLSAYADAIFESTHEMFLPLNPTINVQIGEIHNNNKEKLIKNILPNAFLNFEKILNQFNGDFFLGNHPYYCDFNAYHHFSLSLILDNNILDKYTKIKHFMKSFENLNGIKNYLSTRPHLIDVGKAPKFIINGKEIPTGTNPEKIY